MAQRGRHCHIIPEYRLPELRHQVPLLDAQHAIRLTRANAAAWNIHPNRIDILGFSAGGQFVVAASDKLDSIFGRSKKADFSPRGRG
jgi:acetyl esterase/lipase